MAVKQKILVVDDEPDQVEILREWLVPEYEVVTSVSAASALKEFAASRFDLLVTDFSMPDMNGAQLVSKISKAPELTAVPVLMLTGIQDDLALSVIKSIPRIRVVQKPIRRADFLTLVEEMLKILH